LDLVQSKEWPSFPLKKKNGHLLFTQTCAFLDGPLARSWAAVAIPHNIGLSSLDPIGQSSPKQKLTTREIHWVPPLDWALPVSILILCGCDRSIHPSLHRNARGPSKRTHHHAWVDKIVKICTRACCVVDLSCCVARSCDLDLKSIHQRTRTRTAGSSPDLVYLVCDCGKVEVVARSAYGWPPRVIKWWRCVSAAVSMRDGGAVATGVTAVLDAAGGVVVASSCTAADVIGAAAWCPGDGDIYVVVGQWC